MIKMDRITDERLDEMIKAAKLFAEEPCGGIYINEMNSKDLYKSLVELKEWRVKRKKLLQMLEDCKELLE